MALLLAAGADIHKTNYAGVSGHQELKGVLILGATLTVSGGAISANKIFETMGIEGLEQKYPCVSRYLAHTR